jgi:ABC-type multidrug transport system ATPase subunit
VDAATQGDLPQDPVAVPVGPGGQPGDVLLEAREITKSYGGRTVLDRVTLEMRSGEVVALVGENGAGKSTLLRICARLVAPDAGQVLVHGRVGYCPQDPGLMDLLTAGEHLALFDRAPDLAGRDGLASGWRVLHELGFPVEEARDKVVRNMSGGTRQKVNLALALLGDADVLLLDEPYQGFDHGSYVNFWDYTDEWRAAGRAVVVVTHMLAELSRVDRVVELTVPHPVEADAHTVEVAR